MARRYAVAVCLLIILLFPATASEAATWYVSLYTGDNTGLGTDDSPWQTIQFAINNSVVVDGDTIFVRDGQYIENLDISKEIILRSINGSGLPSISSFGDDANANDHIVAVRADNVTVDGFSISGANDATTSVVAGIYLASGTRYASIINNDLSKPPVSDVSNFYGIYLYNSDDNTISGNVVTHNIQYGIRLYSSERNQITDNEVHHNYRNGIHLNSNSNNNTISGNTVEYNGDNILETGSGLAIFQSSSNTVDDNTFRVNEEHGIHLDDVDDSTISNNMCHFNALNGIYLANDSDGNSIQLNLCTGNGGSGIEVEHSSDNTIDQNGTGSGGHGITLDRSSENDVIDNSCNGNEYGIYLTESPDNDIQDNYVQNNSEYGIYLSQSNDNDVRSNNTFENYSGIVVTNSSDRILIQDNKSNDNDEYGILLSGGSANRVIGNEMNRNDYGLRLSNGTSNNEVSNNTMISGNYGVVLSSTNNNRFWLNSFGNNSLENVSSSSSSNYWVSESWLTYWLDHPSFADDLRQGYLGNHFDDHPGYDSDGDGVTDSPYDLPGTEPDDDFPLSIFGDNFVIVELADGDTNGDGDVNLADVITALQAVSGQTATVIFRNSDMNDDGKIGLIEAMTLLRELSI